MSEDEKQYTEVVTELVQHMQGLRNAHKLGVDWTRLSRLLANPETEVHELLDLLGEATNG